MPADHDAYIAEAPEALRPLLTGLRATLAEALPDAEEVMSYNMPGFRIGEAIVAGYGAFSKQCGLYVAPSAIAQHTSDIAAAGFKATKTGVTFSSAKPIPTIWPGSSPSHPGKIKSCKWDSPRGSMAPEDSLL